MVTFYGSHICGGCREAKELFAQKGFADFQFVEITESTDNLRAFLQLRDHREELRQAREAGMIVCRKPLARRVVPKKACADDEDRKTPFVVK